MESPKPKGGAAFHLIRLLFLDSLSAWVLSLFSSMILFYTIQVYSDLASPFDLAQDMLCAGGRIT